MTETNPHYSKTYVGMTHIAVKLPERSPVALMLVAALSDLGAEISPLGTRSDRVTAPCIICDEYFNAEVLTDCKETNGLTCPICLEVVEKIKEDFRVASERHWREVVAQLPRAIRDVRAGGEPPHFYHTGD